MRNLLIISWVTAAFLVELGFLLQPLQCWRCDNAVSNSDCLQKGRLETCQSNQESCQNEIRMRGRTLRVTKQCKQMNACRSNAKQNKKQCKRGLPVAICRCCCNTDECNKDKLTCVQHPPAKDLFATLDMDRDGFYNEYEVRKALEKSGIQFTEDEFERIIDHFDTDSDGMISQQEFNTILSEDVNSKVWETLRPEANDDVVILMDDSNAFSQGHHGHENHDFKIIAPMKINHANITLEGYQDMMERVGIKLSGSEKMRQIAQKLHKRADGDKDGVVRYQEYGRLSFTPDTVQGLLDELFMAKVNPAETIGRILIKSPSCLDHGCNAATLGCSGELKQDPKHEYCTLCECAEKLEDESICSRGACQNGATCTVVDEEPGFICHCVPPYSGEFCVYYEGISACHLEYQHTEVLYKIWPDMQDGPEFLECTDDGDFKKKQCHKEEHDAFHDHTGACWCVHPKDGYVIFGTETEPGMGQYLECEDLCEPHNCRADDCDSWDCLACPSGELRIDEDGCTLCECLAKSACDESPCLNGGQCEVPMYTDNPEDFFCICQPGYFGEFCERS